MTIDDIARDIHKREDNELAKAFTMVCGSLLLSNGIQPIINKVVEYDENDDLNKYIIRKVYNVSFDIDTSEHDEKIKQQAVDEFKEKALQNIMENHIWNLIVARSTKDASDLSDKIVNYFVEVLNKTQNEAKEGEQNV